MFGLHKVVKQENYSIQTESVFTIHVADTLYSSLYQTICNTKRMQLLFLSAWPLS